jgi:hypothetical protein
MTGKERKPIFERVCDTLTESIDGEKKKVYKYKVYKYKDPKTGQIFEYDRTGIYENDGRKLIPVN